MDQSINGDPGYPEFAICKYCPTAIRVLNIFITPISECNGKTVKARPVRRGLISATTLLLILTLSPLMASAKEAPLWEIGLGLGGLYLPDYRGADNSSAYLLPLPYVEYRGEHFKVDEEGARGTIFSTNRIKLDISLAGGVPVRSDSNTERNGMPNLDPTVEIGPSLEFRLDSAAQRQYELWLRMPWRAAYSVSTSSIANQGWVFAPYFEYVMDRPGVANAWKTHLAIGPIFGDKKYHDYFYEVAPQFETATRPAYSAETGYSGSRITLTLTKRFDNYWVGAFARYDNLSGAVFEDSPLVADKEYFAIGFGIARIIAQSKTKVSSVR